MKSTYFSGTLKAYASNQNPLQTIVEFVLTDFRPNKNKQRIPKSESDNIVSSALNMPLKIDFDDNTIKGHAFSVPIGTLSEVWAQEDVIMARSVLWKEEFPAIDEYLKKASVEGKMIGTSWEIFYDRSEQHDEITDLYGCIVQATTIVDNPAYGDRTKILSIAETLKEKYMDELEAIRAALSNLLVVIDTLYAEHYRKELEHTAIEDATLALEKLKTLFKETAQEREQTRSALDILQQEKMTLEDKLSLAEQARNALEAEKAEASRMQAEQELLEKRFNSLAEIGIVLSEEQRLQRKQRYLALSEESFLEQLDDLRTFSRSVIIETPDTLATSLPTSPKELAQAIKNSHK